MSVGVPHVYRSHRDQKRVLDLGEQKLQAVVSAHVGAGHWSKMGPLQEQVVLLTAEPLSLQALTFNI